MKITHWAILFIVLILPFSIICRDIIQKKNLVLQDQTRIDNILDAATYDGAGALLEELADSLGYGKNIPITQSAAMAAINRFFQTMAVNFNLPSNIDTSKDFFGQYIPVIAIVGYDGLYVYSYDFTPGVGYQYVLKPKIPYSYTDPTTKCVINFTLGNDIKIYIPMLSGDDLYFSGTLTELTQNDIDNLSATLDTFSLISEKRKFIKEYLANSTTNASLILYAFQHNFGGTVSIPSYLLETNATQDYVYNEQNQVVNGTIYNGEHIPEISTFHKLRREVIVGLISSVLREEVNEHDTYADLIGVTYNFNIPDIDRDQWNNTINDISVLAFFQGMPIGTDSYYNNYSLGGARIVEIDYIYATNDMLYHQHDCPIILDAATGEIDDDKYARIFIDAYDAIEEGYHACQECR